MRHLPDPFDRPNPVRAADGLDGDLNASIDRLLDGELTDAQRSDLFTSLRHAPQSARELAETQQMLALLRSGDPGPDLTQRILRETHRRRSFLSPAVRRQITLARAALAASLLLAIGALAVLANHGLKPSLRERPTPVSTLVAQGENELTDSVRTLGEAFGTIRSIAASEVAVNTPPIERAQAAAPDPAARMPMGLASFEPVAVPQPTGNALAAMSESATRPAGAASDRLAMASVVVGLESRRPTLLEPVGVVCTSRIAGRPLDLVELDERLENPWAGIPIEQVWHDLFRRKGDPVVPLPIELDIDPR